MYISFPEISIYRNVIYIILMTINTDIPWVEKYRPNNFDNIVLDSTNRKLLTNIIKKNTFPNLLLYGPPGTGKTTTIINLINSYQERYNQKSKDLMIHLNASDERGIEIIRNQISQFVNAKSLFTNGLKIVILDEVDYMTKNAQQALKYLLQDYRQNIRFCLICNYISRIDESLQNEFVHLRFNELPREKIQEFLTAISNSEKLDLSESAINSIQKLFKSDIRSMINYMQANHTFVDDHKVIENKVWDKLTLEIKKGIKNGEKQMNKISSEYNMNEKNIIKDYLNYVIACKQDHIDSDFLEFAQFIMHLRDPNIEFLRSYFLRNIVKWLSW